ncbi:MAG: hypothetical protein AB7K09_21255, partial [Planctomycetota bacterium]
SALVLDSIPRTRVEAAWSRSAGNPADFARRLGTLMAANKASVDDIIRWALAQAQWGVPLALRAGVGMALAARRYPGIEIVDLLDRMLNDPLPDGVSPFEALFIVAAGQQLHGASNPELATYHAWAAQRAWTMGGMRSVLADPLQYDLLDRTRNWRQTGEFAEAFRQVRCLVLGMLHRRAELIAVSRDGDRDLWGGVMGIPHYVVLHRMIHEEGERLARQYILDMEERGIVFDDR